MATRKKRPLHKVVMTEGKRQIVQKLLQEYDIETAEDIQDALKDLLGGTIKEMMEAEMDNHLGYEKSERSDSDDYRNGYKEKTVHSRWLYADRSPAGSEIHVRAQGCQKTAERYRRHRSEGHLYVCQGDDDASNFRYIDGYLWF